MDHAPTRTPEREQFYKTIDKSSLTPLWEVLARLVTKEPVTPCKPYLWRYEAVRPYIMQAGQLITAKEAERRVLVLENPGLRGQSRITHSLYAGLQLILPGEVAPAHRHMASALRFIIEGGGAYTAVDGEKTIMEEGDFVITPSWTWHDHGNESDRPMVWMDGLDVPLVNTLDASFLETLPQDSQRLTRPAGYSPTHYAHNVLPVGYAKASKASPIFNYPYARTRETLETMRKFDEWDACHGLKVRYVDPTSGDFAMPTIGTFMQLLPKTFKTAAYRSTDGTVYSPVEGRGRTIVNGEVLEWKKRDVFVVPSWSSHHHEADEDAVLFSFSDRPVQQKLGLWREQRGNEPASAPH
jgi:gentisate 1,2-dioxygenase